MNKKTTKKVHEQPDVLKRMGEWPKKKSKANKNISQLFNTPPEKNLVWYGMVWIQENY